MHIIHIAGSKGKSSTALALSSLLCKTGYRTGLFSSPHIMQYNERIKINGNNIDDNTLLWGIQTVYEYIEEEKATNPSIPFEPTMFEKIFAVSLLLFKKMKIQWAIIEVGIGGLFDTTNIVQPMLSIITAIEKEHSDILGETIEEIVRQKAGIIKPHTPVLIGKQTQAFLSKSLIDTALLHKAPYYLFSDMTQYTTLAYTTQTDTIKIELNITLDNTTLCYTVSTSTMLKLIAENQLLALCALHILYKHHYLHKKALEQIQKTKTSLQETRKNTTLQNNRHIITFGQDTKLPCRAELLSGDPPLYLDLAHTAESLFASLGLISMHFTPLVLIMGISKDKDAQTIIKKIEHLLPLFEKIIITNAGTIKPMPAKQLYQVCLQTKQQLRSMICITDHYKAFIRGYTIARKKHAMLVIVGSTYLCADLREEYNKVQQYKEYHHVP